MFEIITIRVSAFVWDYNMRVPEIRAMLLSLQFGTLCVTVSNWKIFQHLTSFFLLTCTKVYSPVYVHPSQQEFTATSHIENLAIIRKLETHESFWKNFNYD